MFGSSVPNGILTSFSGTIIKDMGTLAVFLSSAPRLEADIASHSSCTGFSTYDAALLDCAGE